MTQSFIHIESPNYLRAGELASPADWPALFSNDHPVALEIGCGVGDFIVKTAEDLPDRNFIAIDFYNKGCYKTCRRIDSAGLANVRVLREEARQFLRERIPAGSLAAIYINCPHPSAEEKTRETAARRPGVRGIPGGISGAGGGFLFRHRF